MHSITTLLMSLDKSIHLCVLLLIFLVWRYYKTKDYDFIYFSLSCVSYAFGEICYDYINPIAKLPVDLLFYYLFYFFIFLFFRRRTKFLFKNPILERNSEIITWILIAIDIVVFAVFSYLIYYIFDCTSLSIDASNYSLSFIAISNFIYPLLDFLILRYFIYINMRYIVSDKKLYLPLMIGVYVWAIGDFLIAYEDVSRDTTYDLGNYFQILGLIILFIILFLIKTSKTGSNYTTVNLYHTNFKFLNYNFLISCLVFLYFIIYAYCLTLNTSSFSMNIVKNSGIVILTLVFLRLNIIYYDHKYKLGELSKDASTDPLTGLYSRKYAFAMLRNLYKSSLYFNMKISIIMLDIDHFKSFNDSFGHINGDYTLRKIAQLISGSTDTSNIVCRYGGEEFMIVLPGVDEETGMRTAEKIRNSIETYTFQKSNKITVSIGGATSCKMTKNAIDLIEQADAALYKAKEERNKCFWYESNS